MGLLKSPLDYTKRCDKCRYWVDGYLVEDQGMIVEGDGDHCIHIDRKNDDGYSQKIQTIIELFMDTFMFSSDRCCYDADYRREMMIAMGNCCPIFEHVTPETKINVPKVAVNYFRPQIREESSD